MEDCADQKQYLLEEIGQKLKTYNIQFGNTSVNNDEAI